MDSGTARSTAAAATGLGLAAATVVTVLLLVGGGPVELPAAADTEPGTGSVVGWAVRVDRAVTWVLATLTVGSSLVAAGLTGDARARRRARRAARAAALGWLTAVLVGSVLAVVEVAGIVSASTPFVEDAWVSRAPSGHLLAAAFLVVFVLGCRGGASLRRDRVLLSVAMLAALPVPLSGHTTSAGDGGASASGLVVHVLASLVWVGGLAGVLIHLRHDRTALVRALPRYSTLALGAYVALVGSGLVAASAVLPFTGDTWTAAWESGYGRTVLAKVALVVALGSIGARHRARTLPRLEAGRPRAFLRLAAGEVALMAVAGGVAAALPFAPGPLPQPEAHATAVLDRPTWSTLLLAARPDAVVLLGVGLAVVVYLRASRRREVPAWRAACFLAGAALAVVLTCSGVATYGSALLSVHVAQLLGMLVPVPALIALGRPWELLPGPRSAPVGAAGPARSMRLGAAAAATCVLLLGVYGTPLLEQTLRSSWTHLLVLACASACGLLAAHGWSEGRPGRGADGTASPVWALPVAACVAVLGLRMRHGDQLLAAEWFLELRLGWVDPVADQRAAGGVAVGMALVLVVLALLPLLRPARRGGAQPDVGGGPGRGQSRSSTLPSMSSTGMVP